MSAVPRLVHEGRERATGDPLQRLLAGEAAAHLERRDTEAVAALVLEVDDEAFVDHRVDEVIGGAARQIAGPGDLVQR